MVEVVMEGPAKNALGKALMDQAIAQIEAANGEPLLIRGAGDAFSAGLNLKEILELEADGMKEFLDTLGKLLSVLWHYPGPTVAAVNGHAITDNAITCRAGHVYTKASYDDFITCLRCHRSQRFGQPLPLPGQSLEVVS